MSRVDIPSVSASEFHDLVDSMSSEKPLVPNTLNLLQVLADVFSKEWISNFLFTSDSIHISHLSSPGLENLALTCDLRVTNVTVTNMHQYPSADAIESSKFCARYLLVPCFTAQESTLGVGVMESVEAMNRRQRGREIESSSRLHNLRFVRDSARRSILAVMYSPGEEFVVVHYSITNSHICPYTLAIKFRREEFFAYARERQYQVNLKSLQASLVQYSHTSQLRSCPKCSAPPASGCACYYNAMQLPRHPFDIESFKLSFSLDFGNYQGITNKVMKQDNGPARHVSFGAHTSFQVVFDSVSVHRMSSWALAQHARGFCTAGPGPSISIGMTGRMEPSEMGTGRIEFEGGAILQEGETDAGKELQEQIVDQRGNTLMQSAEQFAVTTGMNPGGNESAVEGIAIPGVEHGSRGKGWHVRNQQHSFPTTPCSLDSSRRPEMDETEYREELEEMFAQQEGSTNQAIVLAEVKDMEIQKEECMSSSASLSAIEEVQSSKYDNCSQARSIAKELQAARRRLQNRASAHRSNMKKKAFINDMKEKLKKSKERIELLREREMKLRLENLRLRKEIEK